MFELYCRLKVDILPWSVRLFHLVMKIFIHRDMYIDENWTKRFSARQCFAEFNFAIPIGKYEKGVKF